MALIWRMTKPLRGTGKEVITDSDFCVLKYLMGMYERGVYSSAVAKKRIYWPEGTYGDQINAHFEKRKSVRVTVTQEIGREFTLMYFL